MIYRVTLCLVGEELSTAPWIGNLTTSGGFFV